MRAQRERRPTNIVVGEEDYHRLSSLALAVQERMPDVAEALLAEMDRADVVPDRKVADSVVRMGSSLEYRNSAGVTRSVTLVYPGDADLAAGRISVLSALGVAVIGLKVGQVAHWTSHDGRPMEITLVSVHQPVAA
ncbi:nucleoside diphosphate kinase regulator [Mesorhizobium sp. NBSH29]|uniref:nucleoside diphosphate kinase regulator n=1 Tax=Mesorhizobium sp. NBSH29 TaxID=2654249 RepID=UPI0018965110|nr:nucleoside diphosphate kinase regulator [Mesorhizobium sp. NBSH29]QPC85926.1 nucleoside diphosphate kinase regulator [Mesorhizobium sp. NBSH29]